MALGSNLGDRAATLADAVTRLAATPGIALVACSPYVETAPVGGPAQGAYLNAAVALRTTLSPRALLAALLAIEAALGRTREVRWGPRTLDLDLLAYDARVVDEPDLVVPHPRMHERRFVLAPLATIAPTWEHPILHRTVRELLAALPPEDATS